MSTAPQQFIALPPFLYEEPGWCDVCNMNQTFVPVFEFDGGRLGYYMGCGHEDVVLFTRTVSRMESEAV